MRQLQTRHILLFRILRDYCAFLTRRQIQAILTLSRVATTKTMLWMLAEGYLSRRYRADSFEHFQTPVHFLGRRGWHVVGKPTGEYKRYRSKIEHRAERTFAHQLAVYDVIIKFVLEGGLKRLVLDHSRLWQEAIDFGNIPDAWVQFAGGEAFIEVDLGTEHLNVFKEKMDRYIKFHNGDGYERLFPDCTFRVLVLVKNEERIEALQQLTTSDDIWFATLEEFVRETLTHPHWFARHGLYALLDSSKEEM